MSEDDTDLPLGWRRAPLDKVASIEDGARVPLNSTQRATRKGPFPYYGANGQVDSIDAFRYEGEHVLVAEDGGYFDDAARGVAYLVSGRFWVNNHAHVLRPREDIEPVFLRDALNRVPWMDYVSGTTRLKLTQASLRRVTLSVPPLDEQRRIVAKLDALRARSRRAKDALDTLPALLSRLRQSILAAAFRGEITADWREQHPDAEPADALRRRIPIPPRPARYDSRSIAVIPGDFALSVGDPDTPAPRGWSWVPLVDIARLESGHTPSRRHPEWWDGDIPWIGLRDASDHHGGTITETRQYTNEAGLANSAARLLPAGTVCLSRTATIGYSFVMGREMATSQDFANWVCTDALDPHWLKLLFVAEKQALLRFSAQSTNIATIYYPSLIAFHVCLPPLEEQREIVRRVSEHIARVEVVRSSVDTAAEELASLDRSVLDKAFRGELLDHQSERPPSVAEGRG